MSFHEILIGIMAVFALLGGIDRILGSRFGLGPRFEEGILAMGTLGLAMIGIVCLAPVLARLLRPIVVPVYGFLGADPAMFAGTLLACDMGGAPLARELALSPEAAGLGGILTGSMLGATVVFTIPVAMGLLRQWASGSKEGEFFYSHAYDMLMGVAADCGEVEVRDAYLEDAERLLLETGYVCPLYFTGQSSRLSSAYTGLLTDGIGGYYFTHVGQQSNG